MQQLAPMDASFLYLESPTTPMHVVGVMLLDTEAGEGGYSGDRFEAMLHERLHLMPAFERRLAPVPLHLDHPWWVHDPDVRVGEHFHRVTCPAPGDLRALGALVGDIAGRVLDRDKPLWEMWLVEGLATGGAAVVAKMHHATLYGAAGADMMAQLLDFGPEGRDVEPRLDDGFPAEQDASAAQMLTTAALHSARLPLRAGQTLLGGLKQAGALGGLVARRAMGGGGGTVGMPFNAPRSSPSGALTRRRDAAFCAVPFADVKAVKQAFGVKVNDVVLAATTDAVRRYLLDHGGLPGKPLVASVPRAVGAGAVAGTDTLGALLIPLPVGEADPVAQLLGLAADSEASKEMADALGNDAVNQAAHLVPPLLFAGGSRLYNRLGLSRLHPPLQSLIVSNMPGPPIPLWCAGARVAAVWPFGPLLPGSGLNVTVLSNMGSLDVGFLGCPDLVPDLWDLADAWPGAVGRLLAAARAA